MPKAMHPARGTRYFAIIKDDAINFSVSEITFLSEVAAANGPLVVYNAIVSYRTPEAARREFVQRLNDGDVLLDEVLTMDEVDRRNHEWQERQNPRRVG